LEIAVNTQIQAFSFANSCGKEVRKISAQVVEKTAMKFQGQADKLFAYYNFEGWRKHYGLIDELIFKKGLHNDEKE